MMMDRRSFDAKLVARMESLGGGIYSVSIKDESNSIVTEGVLSSSYL